MKTSSKIILGSVIALFIGGIIMLIGLSLGIKNGVAIDFKGIHIKDGKTIKIEELNLEEIKNMDINVDYSNVQIIEGDTYGIEISTEEGDKIDWSLENGTLKISQKQDKKASLFNFNIPFWGSLNLENFYVKVYIPNTAEVENISIKVSCGTLIIDNVDAKTFNIDNDYGDITFNNIITETVNIELDCGSLKATNVEATSMKIKNSYGDIDIKDIKATEFDSKLSCGSIDIKTSEIETANIYNDYGDIEIESLKASKCTIESSCGDIDLSGDITNYLEIKSDLGSVEVKLDKDISNYSCDINTDLGSVTINNQKLKTNYTSIKDDAGVLKITNDCGDIKVSSK